MWLAPFLLLAVSVVFLLIRATGLQVPLFHRDHDRVLLVVAHPDDETLFFSPSVLSLTCFGVPVAVLCLSNGGAYGLGKAREKEMQEACQELMVVSPSDVKILDHPELKDGMKTDWPAAVVAQEVHKAVQQYKPTKVITFDSRGVSGHINHICAYRGILLYMRQRQARLAAHGTADDNVNSTPVTFYKLASVNLVRKFSGLLDLPLSSLLLKPRSHLVVNPSPIMTVRALLQHKTQLTWYRVLFAMLSRYTMINTLLEIELE